MDSHERTRVENAPRSATGREWEVFVRETASDPLKHAGSVTAADATAAHEHASRLFEWAAADIWLCPADETHRYTTHSLSRDTEPVTEEPPTGESEGESA